MTKHYELIVTDGKPRGVIATATLANGVTKRAKSKCAPEDTFDAEIGIALADARLEIKLAKYRLREAEAERDFAIRCRDDWAHEVDKRITASAKRFVEKVDAVRAYNEFLEKHNLYQKN